MADRVVVNVRVFARLREVCGDASEMTLEIAAPATVADCFEALCGRCAAARGFRDALAVAVNDEYAAWDTPVGAADTVAFIPPVSGG